MQSIVKLSNLSKTFPGARALSHVDFELRAGAIHALVGENGAGKSTLINILNGIFPPDEGSISIDGQTVQLRHAQQAHRLGIVTVYQDADLFPDLSLAENIAFQQRSSTLDPEQALRSMQLSLSPSMPASELTAAQRQILSIGIAVSQKAKVLILDEPTSSLSQAEAQLLFEHLRRLRKEGVAILYVSHRLEDIFALADEVSVLRDGERVWSGPITETSTEHLIQQMVGRAVELTMRQPVHETGDVIFSCEHLSASDGSFSDVSLEVRAGEVLGMYGLIGAGRSEWAQTVFGLRSASEGEVKVHGTPSLGDSPHHMIEHGLIYLTEDRLRQGVCSELALRANAVISSLRRLSSFLWTPAHRESQTSQKVIEQLSVKAHSEHQSIGTLSGGNQQKVVLGRWLSCEPDVMILDEPTQGIDIGSKTEIHQLIHDLAEKGKAIILISSDLPEVLSQSDRVLVFREGRIVGEFQARDASAEDLATAAFTSGETESVTSEQSERTKPSRAWQWPVRELSLFAIVILFFLLMHLSTGEFLSPSGIRNRVTDASLLSLCALAATLVLLVGGLDISLGSLMALSAAVAGSYWEQGLAWPLAVILAMLIGAAGGWLNAALSLIGRVHPIVITLGTLSLYRGLTLWWLKENLLLDDVHRRAFLDRWVGLEMLAWLALGVIVLTWVFLRRTTMGRKLYAMGSNPVAAYRVGMSRPRVWMFAFAAQGALLGLAGLLYLIRSGDLQGTGHEEKTLLAIAAAVVGGVSITGGRGSAWGVFLGSLFLVSLAPACTLLRIPMVWQRTLVGFVMVVAVSVDVLWRRERDD